MARLAIRMSDTLRAALEVRAVSDRRSPSEVVRFALEEYLGAPLAGSGTEARTGQSENGASERVVDAPASTTPAPDPVSGVLVPELAAAVAAAPVPVVRASELAKPDWRGGKKP